MAVPVVRRVVALLVALAVGVALGALGIVMQASRSQVAGHQVPWGLVVTLAVLAIVVRAACWYARSRSAGVLVAVGWVAATIVLALTGPGGDVLLHSITRSWVYLIGGLIIVLVAAILPLPKQDPAPVVTSGAVAVGPGDEPWHESTEPLAAESVARDSGSSDSGVTPVATPTTGADTDDR